MSGELVERATLRAAGTVQCHRWPKIGLVVPALEQGGGVPSVAEFVCDTIERSQAFDLKVVSLAASYRDALSVSLTGPASWMRGVTTSEDTWQGRRFTRIGTFASELEFQRYRPRHALCAVLADCDLVQVVCGSPASALAVCGLGKPVAVHCATRAVVERRTRHARFQGPSEAWRRWMTMITDRMERKALRSVEAIQVMNAWMFDYARDLNAGRPSIVRLVPPGVDSLRFKPAARRDLQSGPYVLTVGRLNDPRKNVTMLLDAFAALPSVVRSDSRLVLAGSASPSPEFWARVKEFGLDQRVTFVNSPTIEELIAPYQTATVFASSSDEEGFGMAIVEAMACGIPVVSTRSGGPDGIIRDGHDGCLTDVGNVGELTDRLTRLLSSEPLNRSLGEAARKTVLERFDSRIAGKALLETYESLLTVVSRPFCMTESRVAILRAQ
jgi:glycosyltransferase involved in cell wall biosynthesis